MSAIDKYRDALARTGPAGCGNNTHSHVLRIANCAVKAGIDPNKTFNDTRAAIPPGGRHVSDKEIWDAINKAYSEHNRDSFTSTLRQQPIVNNGKTALQRIIEQGTISDEADLWECSPIRLYDEPEKDPVAFLENLFPIDALIWIGTRYQEGIMGATIRTRGEWIQFFRNGGVPAPQIIINPLSGLPALKKGGEGKTYRGDLNVKTYRYCLVEFDNLSRGDQIRFWSAVKLPIVALIDTGGKSIHAWIDVSRLTDVGTLDQWQSEIKTRLYDKLLTPMGTDAACANPARLSRLPGHYREEKGRYQKLLWLSPEGRTINGNP